MGRVEVLEATRTAPNSRDRGKRETILWEEMTIGKNE